MRPSEVAIFSTSSAVYDDMYDTYLPVQLAQEELETVEG